MAINGQLLKCAMVYDFDGTLAEGNCVEHGLLPALGVSDRHEFWRDVKDRTTKNDADEILTYLDLLVEHAAAKRSLHLLDYSSLRGFGKEIPLFDGVESWFPRINDYAQQNGVELVHYVISSGLEAMIEGSAIGDKFEKIFGCKFRPRANEQDFVWPAQTINFTTKTQFLFRINKGIENSWNNDGVNKFVEPEERPIPFSRMIFLGDGDTDIPSMKMVRYQGGKSIAVFDQKKWAAPDTQKKVEKLISEERTDYVVPADYHAGSQLDVTVKGILQLIKRKAALRD